MKVLFLQKDIFAKPAIMSLSAVLKKAGHECDLLVDDLEKDIAKKAIATNPDIIAFSITTGEYSWMNNIGGKLRKDYTGTVICGGPHPTFFPKVIQEDYLDAVCIGEGEEAIVEYVNALESNNDTTAIENFVVKLAGEVFENDLRPLILDLDSLPFYDRDIYQKYKPYRNSRNSILFHTAIKAGRGCPHQCTFCFNKRYSELYRGKGKRLRRRSAQNVIEELLIMKQDRDLRFISIEDDSFLAHPREWLTEFLSSYKDRINIPFKIQTSADLVDEDIVKQLKEANCHAMRMGLETGNEDFRNRVLQKRVSNDNLIQAALLAKKYGIKLQTFNIVGNPGESLEMALETFDLNKRIRPDFVWCSLLNPYPGTDIFSYAVDNGYITESADCRNIGHSYFIDTPMKLENKTEIRNLQKMMFACILLHLPRKSVEWLIKLPLTRFYGYLFGMTFLLGLCRMDRITLYGLSRLPLVRLLRYA